MDRKLNPAAVIFDMDGVLMDSEPLHFLSFRAFLSGLGVDYTEDQHRGFVGQTSRQILGSVKAENPQIYDPLDMLIAGRQEHFASLIQGPLDAMNGVVETLRIFSSKGIPLAVASSSSRSQVETILRNVGIRSCFSAVVTGDDVARSKPEPEIYLSAAGSLGVAPEQCLVFEDSNPGVRAGVAAGAFVIAVPCESTAHHDLSSAQMQLNSLGDFQYEETLRRFQEHS